MEAALFSVGGAYLCFSPAATNKPTNLNTTLCTARYGADGRFVFAAVDSILLGARGDPRERTVESVGIMRSISVCHI